MEMMSNGVRRGVSHSCVIFRNSSGKLAFRTSKDYRIADPEDVGWAIAVCTENNDSSWTVVGYHPLSPDSLIAVGGTDQLSTIGAFLQRRNSKRPKNDLSHDLAEFDWTDTSPAAAVQLQHIKAKLSSIPEEIARRLWETYAPDGKPFLDDN